VRSVLSVVCLMLSVGCSKPPASVVPSAPAPRDVAASWDGGLITTADVRLAVHQLGPTLREQFDTPAGRTQFIDALVAKKLLASEARRRGLDHEVELTRQVADLEERLLIQAVLAEDAKTTPAPSEPQLRTWYAEHEDAFRQKAAVHIARGLMLKASPKARERLEKLRQRLLKGEPRERVLADGEGAERKLGGDVGWVEEPITPLADAALALKKPGEVSPLVELPDAFAIAVLVERREARLPPFEEVKEAVASHYAPVAQRQAFDRLVKRLMESSSVKVNAAALQ
jgi:parvulin-like peptidyl-prolyl isomerase